MTQYNVHTAREFVERQMRIDDPKQYRARIAVLDTSTNESTIEDWVRAAVDLLVGKLEKVDGARQVRPVQWRIKISAEVDTLPASAVPEGFVLPAGLNGVVTPDDAEEVRS